MNAEQLRLDALSTELSSDTGVESMISDCANGDYSACIQILETLAADCELGDGLSCDVLFEVSPVGSGYEAYGATCGGRADATYADQCRNYDLGT